MQKTYKIAIVGGGSAGLMTAIELLSGSSILNASDVIILERNDRVGKKLIATGNGQGNLTNTNFSAEFYHGEKGFIRAFIEQARAINLQKYLTKLGVFLTVRPDGKVYPLSKQASAVLDIFRAYLLNKGVEEKTSTKIDKIDYDGKVFTLYSETPNIKAERVVLAFGGKSAKQFGTDGTAYALAESFGHKTTELYPSLVQLKTDLTNIKGLKGLKENVKLSAFDGDRELKSATGELLFTEYGVSGNAVFQISTALTDVKNPQLCVEFLPEISKKDLLEMLIAREKNGYIHSEDYLVGILNKRVGQAILKRIEKKTPNTVANALKDFRIRVTGNLGFNYSQVTKGGIQTDKINPYTMESKLQKNLYVIGEALDVDGDCGGYNLTFAFVSGIISARAIKAKLLNTIKTDIP